MNKCQLLAFIIINLFVLIFFSFIFVIPLNFNRIVEQDEYVVQYNVWTNTFKKRILTQGRYITLIPIDFYKFKRTLQNIELDGLDCMSKDKVILKLNIMMQIQYYPEYLISTIMLDYNNDDNYKKLIKSIVTSTILNTCLKWNVEQYYMDRSQIDNSMYNSLIKNVNQTTIQTQIVFFQLIDIKFPSQYSDLIKEKQNIDQNKQTALNERTNQLTQAQTQIIINKKLAQINLINANMTSNIKLNKADSVSNQIKQFWNYRTNYLVQVVLTLGLNNIQLIDYLKQEKISQNPNLIVGIEKN